MTGPAPADAPSREDLLTLLRNRAFSANSRTLHVVILIALAGLVAAVLFGGKRYYLALPFLAAVSFGMYGLAARRVGQVSADAEADHARSVDARIVMKVAGIVGMASAIAALICFFLLVLGPSWIS